MPNPKSGTVTMDVAKAITDIKAGKVEYRVDKTNICHCPVGKVSFGKEKIGENLNTLMDAIIKQSPQRRRVPILRASYSPPPWAPASSSTA